MRALARKTVADNVTINNLLPGLFMLDASIVDKTTSHVFDYLREDGSQVYEDFTGQSVRQYYRSIGYYDQLTKARKAGQQEPDIPPLPGSEVKKVSDLYIEMFERLTGESFR